MSDPGLLKRALCVGPRKISRGDASVIYHHLRILYPYGVPRELLESVDAGDRDGIVDVLFAIDDARGGDKSFDWLPEQLRNLLNKEWIGKRVAAWGLTMLYAGTGGCDCCAGWRVVLAAVAIVSQAAAICWLW